MKRGWKIFWIVCGAVAGIGFVCGMAGVAMGATADMIDGRFSNGFGIIKNSNSGIATRYDNGEPAASTDAQEEFTGINEIDIDVSGLAIQILESDSQEGTVRLETADVDSRLKLQYYAQDGELTVKTRKDPKWLNENYYGTVWLYLPKGKMAETDLQIGAGTLYIQSLNTDSATINVGAGEVSIDQFNAVEADFKCGAGRITAAGDVTEELEIKCGVGECDFTLNGKSTDYNYNASAGIGNVVVGGLESGGFGAGSGADNGAARDISIQCGIGSVNIDFAELP